MITAPVPSGAQGAVIVQNVLRPELKAPVAQLDRASAFKFFAKAK